MTNLLQANGLTAFSNVDYDTFKEWANVFNNEFGLIDFMNMEENEFMKFLTPEKAYRLGAFHMIDDVVAMIENPATETVKAFKQLTAPGINKWVVIGTLASIGVSAWLAPRVVYMATYGRKAYYEKTRRGGFTWKGLI